MRLPWAYEQKIHDKIEVVERYFNGESGPDISSYFGCHPGTIYNVLEDADIERRISSETSRTHRLNDRFFSVWTPAMAYWLGVLCADGCSNRSKLLLTRKPIDKDHLYQFRDALSSDYEPKQFIRGKSAFDPGSVGWKITVNSVGLVSDLAGMGFNDFKTGSSHRLLNNIPDGLFGHWLRGMTDGDGTVCYVLDEYPAWRLVHEHRDSLWSIARRIAAWAMVTPLNVYQSKTIWVITAKRRKGLTLLNRIYAGATDFLKRKKVIYENIVNGYT